MGRSSGWRSRSITSSRSGLLSDDCGRTDRVARAAMVPFQKMELQLDPSSTVFCAAFLYYVSCPAEGLQDDKLLYAGRVLQHSIGSACDLCIVHRRLANAPDAKKRSVTKAPAGFSDRVYFSMLTGWSPISFTRVDVNGCPARCERFAG